MSCIYITRTILLGLLQNYNEFWPLLLAGWDWGRIYEYLNFNSRGVQEAGEASESAEVALLVIVERRQ